MGAKRHFALPMRLRGGDAIHPIEGRTQLPLHTCVRRRKLGKICTCTRNPLRRSRRSPRSGAVSPNYSKVQEDKRRDENHHRVRGDDRSPSVAKDAKVWKQKITECVHKRSAYQDQPSARLMSLEYFGSKLQELDDARRLARAELESLMRRQKHIEQLEQGLPALLKSMAELIPDALEGLMPEERNKIHRMLRLEVTPFEEGYKVGGAFCSSEPRLLKCDRKDPPRTRGRVAIGADARSQRPHPPLQECWRPPSSVSSADLFPIRRSRHAGGLL
jgi:hypothetical protein